MLNQDGQSPATFMTFAGLPMTLSALHHLFRHRFGERSDDRFNEGFQDEFIEDIPDQVIEGFLDEYTGQKAVLPTALLFEYYDSMICFDI